MIILAPTRTIFSEFLRLLFDLKRVAGRRVWGVCRALDPDLTSALWSRIAVEATQVSDCALL